MGAADSREHTRFDHRTRPALTAGALALCIAMLAPPAEALTRDVVERAIENALKAANDAKIRGPAMTPWLLSELGRATEGRTIRVNLALLEANARLAAELSVCLSDGDS